MKEVFEKIIEKLETVSDYEPIEYDCNDTACVDEQRFIATDDAIKIVKQEASEYNNGWIPVSERLPDEVFGCLVTVMDCNPSTQTDFENILPYFVGYDGETWNDADGEEIPFEVIAWQPLPQPFQKGE